ncbi:DUF2169 domain-containing protein [Polyangium sp. y55x31]|uniref:DUF2169 family type VI secretion system accessory protein n=1 Tax=Polyangium sp. y55x31 TaxID=3042688 RepID=UPI002482B6DF|nr:DUF2169 domain-containing protein [Polyangium sp. y55x31]MDI1480868.1 DUF2169 domain-containing protein [Polyangium sp. y55x31]
MALVAHWPVPITSVGPSKGGTTVFRHAGKLHVTCVLKATFKLVPNEPMQPLAPEELFRAEMHHRDNPTRSIRATSDVVPHLPRVDIVLSGHACAPAGTTVTRQVVRLAVFHGHALLDKTLHVYGDRKGAEITPFDKIPLVYERALGGIGFRPNPHGTGKSPGSAPPNIVYPTDGSLVAGFGPISRALAQRKLLLGSLSPMALEQPVPEIPADFDWTYFQAAPHDQQIESLVGNEWIVLEGLHPEHPRISSRLPTARGLVTLFGLSPGAPEAARTIAMRPDILRIDADTLRCSLVCRVVVPLDDERALGTLRVAGGIETEGRPLAHLLTPPPMPEKKGQSLVATVDDLATTMARGDMGRSDTARSDTWSRGGNESTMVLEDIVPSSEPMPFAQRREKNAFEGTYALDGDAAVAAQHKPAIPFAGGPKTAVPSASGAPIPGAPWSHVPVEAAPVPIVEEATRALSFASDLKMLDFVEEDAEPPPPPPSAPAPAAPKAALPAAAAPPAPPRPARTDPWAESPKEPKVEIPKPPPPRIPPKPAVNKSLYGGFGPPKKKS